MASISELRQRAQDGRDTMKAAIVQFLATNRSQWFKRSEIEEALGLGSTYTGSDSKSYEGGLAAMLLSELATHDKQIDRKKDGQAWLYRARSVGLQA